jgi:hypothetical protein
LIISRRTVRMWKLHNRFWCTCYFNCAARSSELFQYLCILTYPNFFPNSHFSLSVLLLTVRPLRLRAEIRNLWDPAKSTEQNPTLKATCFSAGQEIPPILWSSKVPNRFQKCPSLVPLVSHFNPDYAFLSYLRYILILYSWSAPSSSSRYTYTVV